MTAENPPTKSGRSRLMLWVVVVAGIAVLYALSAGPALMLAQRRIVATETVMSIYFSPYSPLEMATSFVPGIDGLMKAYLGFWQSLTPEPQ